jgi:hypothetical protein
MRAIDALKNRLTRPRQSRISANQKTKNVFGVLVETLKYLFLDLSHVAFWEGKYAENDFALSADYIEIMFSPPRRSRNLDLPGSRK